MKAGFSVRLQRFFDGIGPAACFIPGDHRVSGSKPVEGAERMDVHAQGLKPVAAAEVG